MGGRDDAPQGRSEQMQADGLVGSSDRGDRE